MKSTENVEMRAGREWAAREKMSLARVTVSLGMTAKTSRRAVYRGLAKY
jgi:hypothetical protein